MPKVALVDVDDTLADTQALILKHINTVSDQAYLMENMTQEFREGRVGEYELLVREFLGKPELVLDVAAYPYAQDCLKELKERGYQIHIASARKETLHDTTERWLKKHGLMKYVDAVHRRFSHHKGHEFKVQTAKKVKAEVAFDDTLDVAEALAANGIHTYLIDKPWNKKDELPGNLVRVSDFASAVRMDLES